MKDRSGPPGNGRRVGGRLGRDGLRLFNMVLYGLIWFTYYGFMVLWFYMVYIIWFYIVLYGFISFYIVLYGFIWFI